MAKGAPIYKLTQPDAPLRDSAGVLLVRLQEMYDWADAMHDPANVYELHAMRIAAKRLRYTMEFFVPCFPREFAAALKTVEEIQERIGAIHDCDVIIPLLEKTLKKEMKREHKQAMRKGGGPPRFLAAEGLAPLIAARKNDRDRLYADFVTFWDLLPPTAFFTELTELIQREANPHPIPEDFAAEDAADAAAEEASA